MGWKILMLLSRARRKSDTINQKRAKLHQRSQSCSTLGKKTENVVELTSLNKYSETEPQAGGLCKAIISNCIIMLLLIIIIKKSTKSK